MTASISLIFSVTGWPQGVLRQAQSTGKHTLVPTSVTLKEQHTCAREKVISNRFLPHPACSGFWWFSLLAFVSCLYHESIYVLGGGWRQWFCTFSFWMSHWLSKRRQNRGLIWMKFLLYKSFWLGEKQLFYLNNMVVFKPWRRYLILFETTLTEGHFYISNDILLFSLNFTVKLIKHIYICKYSTHIFIYIVVYTNCLWTCFIYKKCVWCFEPRLLVIHWNVFRLSRFLKQNNFPERLKII